MVTVLNLSFILPVILLALFCFSSLIVIRPLRAWLGTPCLTCLALSLAAVMSKHAVSAPGEKSFSVFLLYALLHLAIGGMVGLPWALCAEMPTMIGRLWDVLRGAQFAEQVTPEAGEGDSSLEALGTFCAGMAIVSFGGLHQLILALWEISKMRAKFFRETELFSSAVVSSVLYDSARIMQTVLSCVAPLLIICLALDLICTVGLRFLGRANVMFEVLTLKLAFGLLIGVVLLSAKAGWVELCFSSVVSYGLK